MSKKLPKIIVLIKDEREKAGKSQAELAEAAGITKGHLSLLERGERNLTLQMLVNLSFRLNCNVGDLFRLA